MSYNNTQTAIKLITDMFVVVIIVQLCNNSVRVVSACVHHTRRAVTAHTWLLLCAILVFHSVLTWDGNCVCAGCVIKWHAL